MNTSLTAFTTKNGITISIIAKDFICADVGDRISTVSDYEKSINFARGTIQNSIKVLTLSGAVKLESRGALGTFIKEKDLTLLLQYAQITFLIGIMPLPYTRIYQGLATGILHTLQANLVIPVNMAYMRGAQKRADMIVNNRFDFAITSKYAALEYIKENSDIEIIQEFGDYTFLYNHVLIFADKSEDRIKSGMKIGVDYDSIDQSMLTKKVCEGLDVEFVSIQYNQLIEKLLHNEIDATVWSSDEVKHLSHFNIQPIMRENADNTIAVIIINKERQELTRLIGQMINPEEVRSIQNKVINEEMLPSY